MSLLTDRYIITKEASFLLDKKAVEINLIDPVILMEEAAEKITLELSRDFPDLTDIKIAVIAGWGNNGGDALSVARKLFFKGINTDIYIFPDKSGSDLFIKQKSILSTLPVNILDASLLIKEISSYTLVIDGIFGTGYRYQDDPLLSKIFSAINASKCKVVSIDVPSGLTTDGKPCIKADYTYSIGYIKDMLLSVNTREFSGDIRDFVISFDIRNLKDLKNIFYLDEIPPLFRKNERFIHKYERGGCISVGGEKGKCGAVVLSARSAFRSGSGIVQIFTEKDNISPINSLTPEIIVDDIANIRDQTKKYRSAVIGPGLGFTDQKNTGRLIDLIKNEDKDYVLDASFFTIFDKSILKEFKRAPVLTPHAQEFKAFFGDDAKDLDADTISLVRETAMKYRVNIVFKDAFIIFSQPDGKTAVFDHPMRILAQAGSGDILSGIIGGLLAQGYGTEDSVLEALRVFYKTASYFEKTNSISYDPELFINMISYFQMS